MLTVEKVIEMENMGISPGFSMFWAGELSNFHPSKFEIDGETYLCGEQWMMQQKALLFGDVEISIEIMKQTEPKKMKALGRRVKDFDPKTWDDNKVQIVRRGLMEKFRQNPHLWKHLDGTGFKILVESSPYDDIWGIKSRQNKHVMESASNWNGQNLLGFILTDIRESIREERSIVSNK